MAIQNRSKVAPPDAVTEPAYISHYGIRAQRYKEMIRWYQTVFRAKIQHENEFLVFITFDESLGSRKV